MFTCKFVVSASGSSGINHCHLFSSGSQAHLIREKDESRVEEGRDLLADSFTHNKLQDFNCIILMPIMVCAKYCHPKLFKKEVIPTNIYLMD